MLPTLQNASPFSALANYSMIKDDSPFSVMFNSTIMRDSQWLDGRNAADILLREDPDTPVGESIKTTLYSTPLFFNHIFWKQMIRLKSTIREHSFGHERVGCHRPHSNMPKGSSTEMARHGSIWLNQITTIFTCSTIRPLWTQYPSICQRMTSQWMLPATRRMDQFKALQLLPGIEI